MNEWVEKKMGGDGDGVWLVGGRAEVCMDVFLLGGLIGVGGVIGYVGTVAE